MDKSWMLKDWMNCNTTDSSFICWHWMSASSVGSVGVGSLIVLRKQGIYSLYCLIFIFSFTFFLQDSLTKRHQNRPHMKMTTSAFPKQKKNPVEKSWNIAKNCLHMVEKSENAIHHRMFDCCSFNIVRCSSWVIGWHPSGELAPPTVYLNAPNS